MQRGPRATGNSLPRSGRNLRATFTVQLLQGRVPQDFQHWCHRQSTWSAKKGTLGRKGRQSVAAPFLQVTFASPTICNCLFHIFGLSMLPNVQRNRSNNGLNIRRKKKRRLTNWPNIATKFARRGTVRSLLLSNWSSWHRATSATQWAEFESKHQSSISPGESSARLPAGLRPHRHLWREGQSTWSAQKGTCGDQRTAICCRSSCK